MKVNFFLIFLVIYFIPETGFSQENTPMKYFELSSLVDQNENREAKYLRFINEPSLSMGLYSLSTDDIDEQEPHLLDEVYYVVEGKAKLGIGEEYVDVKPGSIVYVRAHVPHRFYDIEDDLQVLVIFSKSEEDSTSPKWGAFDMDELRKKRTAKENVWKKFLDVSSMRFGLYMLPQVVGGDSELNHDFDEINIVVNGRSNFTVNEETIEVQPGSIFYVQKGNAHHFSQLKDENIKILVLSHGGS